jgi:DNA invertase Pin-like site-specific DNA recombinase
MTRCFIVNRVSSEKQSHGISIAVQRHLHPLIATQLGCTYSKEDIFDLAVSSTTFDHHHWDAVKKAVASGRYSNGYAIFGAIDRYHRDKPELLELLVHLLRFNIKIALPDTERTNFLPNEKIPLKTYDADQFKDLIQLVFEIEEAESFKRRLVKRLKLSFSLARESGIDLKGTGAPNYGQHWNPKRSIPANGRLYGKWEVEPSEAKIVKIIFAQNLKSVRMAQWLNQHVEMASLM